MMQAVPRRQRTGRRAAGGGNITPAGLSYLKCVTAPNDSEMDTFQGIPDTYDGRTIAKRHTSTTSMVTPVSGEDHYICLLPTPGVAYWYGARATGATTQMTLNPVYYSDFTTLFPNSSEDSVVNSFRYASNVIEIVPTANQMSWGGSISVWKGQLSTSLGAFVSAGTAVNYVLDGDEAVNSVKPESVLPFNQGMYSITCCNQPTMPFTPVMVAQTPAGLTSSNIVLAGANHLIGVGCQESVIIKMPFSVTTNSALIRTWACVEYTVNSSSLFYDYSRLSPPCDPTALAMFRRFIHEQPTAVPYYENESFWKRFVAWVREVSGPLKVLPGVAGEVAGIVNLTSKLILDNA